MPSDAVAWAYWLGLGAIALALLQLLCILLLRGWLGLRERRRQRLWQLWRALCMDAACGLVPSVPPLYLSDSNWLLFFQLWHHYLLNVGGEAPGNLQRLGRSMGLHHIAIKILNRAPSDRELIAATVAAGWLRDIRAWEPLLLRLHDEDPVRSFSAARALTRINTRSALREVIPLLVTHPDWPRHLVAGLLLEAGPVMVSPPLLNAILNTPDEQVSALVRYLPFADVGTANIVLNRYMITGQNHELLCACLKAACSPKVLPLVLNSLSDAHWEVRVGAANALCRLGDSSDVASLQPLLSDQQWWVRYRAAQAIGELLRRDKAQMMLICQAQTDRYAADMLEQVMAEWEEA
ncbi:MAG: HEAT repeat domain-containing protein [Methylobacter sp.]|jgi:hypothetical protein|nr:HEAT repeat domain-containing protein [Methylobacter sp.]